MSVNKVLVVDDSMADLSNIKTIIADAGYDVLSASNGRDAVAMAKLEHPDVIFMDVIMPEMDGFAACREIQKDTATKNIPVVFVTSKNQKADRLWAQMQGGKGYITKPFSPEEIIDQIKRTVNTVVEQTGLSRGKPWFSPSVALNRVVLPQDGLLAEANLLPLAAATIRYGFRVGEIGFIVPQETVSEVMELLPLYPLPNTPNWLRGLANLRGNLVPVMELRLVLGLSDQAGEQMLLVLGEGEQAVGILIDDLPVIPDLSHQLAHTPPVPAMLREHVISAYVTDGRPWIEFNYDDFFRALAGQAGT